MLCHSAIHLTRDGQYVRYADVNRLQGERLGLSAKSSFESILKNNMLEARSAFGAFNLKVPLRRGDGTMTNPGSRVDRNWLLSVCFTETPLAQIHFQVKEVLGRRLDFKPYGLAFFEQSLRAKGGNPVFYFNSENEQIVSTLNNMATSEDCHKFKSILPLYEAFGPRLFKRNALQQREIVDFRWEREWRINGNFMFSSSDIAFGICPLSEIEHFQTITKNSVIFVDPTRQTLDEMTARLKENPKLLNLI
jgi:hypothetical protein